MTIDQTLEVFWSKHLILLFRAEIIYWNDADTIYNTLLDKSKSLSK